MTTINATDPAVLAQTTLRQRGGRSAERIRPHVGKDIFGEDVFRKIDRDGDKTADQAELARYYAEAAPELRARVAELQGRSTTLGKVLKVGLGLYATFGLAGLAGLAGFTPLLVVAGATGIAAMTATMFWLYADLDIRNMSRWAHEKLG